MIFKHFLITRINLGYKTRILEQGRNEEEWLDYRFKLFFKTCLPSVLNQVKVNFVWLIYVDKSTPTVFLRRLHDKVKEHHHIEVLLKEGEFDDLKHHLLTDIPQRLNPDVNFLITSRIDSDDLIHKNYIIEVQNQFNCQKYLSLNFNFGWVYDGNCRLLGKAKNKSNPFISLIEEISSDWSCKTVFWQSHTDFISENDRLEINNVVRMWCMNIHQVNDSTKFFGLPVFSDVPNLASDFSFDFDVTSDISIKLRFLMKYYKRQSKKVFKYLLKVFAK